MRLYPNKIPLGGCRKDGLTKEGQRYMETRRDLNHKPEYSLSPRWLNYIEQDNMALWYINKCEKHLKVNAK